MRDRCGVAVLRTGKKNDAIRCIYLLFTTAILKVSECLFYYFLLTNVLANVMRDRQGQLPT